MKRLFTLYRAPGLDMSGTLLYRKAYRAIIWREGKLLMVKSRRFGEFKFPGGGQNDHEKAHDVLKREVAEETGYHIYSKIVPFGSTMEYSADVKGQYDLFQQYSLYYVCRVHEEAGPTALEGYEIEYGYEPFWVTPEEAIAVNERVPKNDWVSWKERDTQVLKLLVEGRKMP
jgi:8-oxo-dGTP pyrophosphatase MutT (NUDIX family)